MTTTEIIAKEQILTSLMKQANAEMCDANERKSYLTKQSDIDEMNEDIKNFRATVIKPIQTAISVLDTEKKAIVGITDFTWRH